MSDHIVIVDKPGDWKPSLPNVTVVAARDYLAAPHYARQRQLRVTNLCRSYRYLSVGYYCSLLAEARQHRVMPSVRTLNDLSRRSIYSLDFDELSEQVQRALRRSHGGLTVTALELDVFFGHCQVRALAELARQLFDNFRAPILKIEFRHQDPDRWRLHAVKAGDLQSLTPDQTRQFGEALEAFASKRWRQAPARRRYRYDLAILHNPDEKLPPSDSRALRRFARAGRALGIDVELIGRKDLSRLAEFDALFIRETTALDHYTYQFARKADREGLVVIDDPESIVRCTNKVYLEELLRAHNVPTPKTMIVTRETVAEAEATLAFPMVLKIPDGSFSRGVYKVETRAELLERAGRLFKSSDLLLVQEYLYTEYDWRIGVIDRRALFACQYFMSKQHWQIYNHSAKRQDASGDSATLAVDEAPPAVVESALRAANLIGDGFYGVDLKQTDRGVVVIEVNDNPNVDVGVEDLVLQDELYRAVLDVFLRRLESRGQPRMA